MASRLSKHLLIDLVHLCKRFRCSTAPNEKLNSSGLVTSLVASLIFGALACRAAAGQNSHAGPETGVIDGVAFEGDQYYVPHHLGAMPKTF
jgi:hypothetical protein